MKLKILFFILCLSPLALLSQGTTVKSGAVTFNFVSKDVDGSLSGFNSSSTIDFENPENSKFKGSVAVKSIRTGIFLRDWSLKGRKYFDEDEHPRIYFESTSVFSTSDGFSVKGTLTIKNIDKPITINFKKNNSRLIGTTTLYSSDFGINIKKKREDNKVNVRLVFDLN
ncbi:MAG: YceI family protein [Aurantibacter sp.]